MLDNKEETECWVQNAVGLKAFHVSIYEKDVAKYLHLTKARQIETIIIQSLYARLTIRTTASVQRQRQATN